MIKLPDESAFDKWFKAVEAGDDAEWTEPKYLSSEWNEYLHRRQLALGAWRECQAEVQRLNANAQPVSDGWVKCGESLPYERQSVFGWQKNTRNVIECYREGMRWYYHYSDGPCGQITHWMPLPAAPGGQDD